MASADNTVISLPGQFIIDTRGNTWSIINGRVAVNGTADATTGNVIQLAYENGLIWQKNTTNLWWSKSAPSGQWQPSYGTITNPVPGVIPSADNAVVAAGSGRSITDSSGNVWTVAGGQVALNGVADGTTGRVIALAYEDGKIWQENADHLWWSKTKPSDNWGPTYGTSVDPQKTEFKSWLGGNNDYSNPANWSPAGVPHAGDMVPLVAQVLPETARTINFNNAALPPGLDIQVVGEPTPILFNLSGNILNGGLIETFIGHNAPGDTSGLTIDVVPHASFTNSGTLESAQGIGFGVTNLKLEAGSHFNNTGTLSAIGIGQGQTPPEVNISGAGRTSNTGLINLQNGKLNLTFDDAMSNSGSLVAGGNSQAIINIGTTYGHTSSFINSGVVEADGNSSISFNGLPAFENRYGQVVNSGLIEVDGGHVSVDGDLKQTGQGHVSIDNGGTLTVDRSTDDGTIQISRGMLEFTGGGRMGLPPFGATGFHSTLMLTGPTAELGFTGDITEELRIASSSAADLMVYTHYFPSDHRPLADIHLAGAYSPDQFSVSGHVINFVAMPS
jgi:hypothetical protein